MNEGVNLIKRRVVSTKVEDFDDIKYRRDKKRRGRKNQSLLPLLRSLEVVKGTEISSKNVTIFMNEY